MAFFYRIIFGALVGLASFSAAASFPVPTVSGWYTAGLFGSTPEQSCALYKQGDVSGTIQSLDPYGRPYTPPPYWCKPVNSWQQTASGTSSQCPSNSTLSGSSCTCTAPYIENTSQTACVAPPTDEEQACKNFQVIENSTLGVVREEVSLKGMFNTGETICVPTPGPVAGVPIGCTVNFTLDIRTLDANGDYWAGGTIDTQNGFPTVPCSLTPSTTDPTAPPKADPNICPSGQQLGQINGENRCMPYGKGTTTTTNKSEENEKNDANGKTIEQKDSVTICVNGKCTTTETTTTTNTPTGSSTSTSTSSSTTKVQGKDEYCKANPTSKECDSTGSGGTEDGKCRPGDNSVGCSELGGIPGATPVSNVNKAMTITKDTGWGASNGSCPAPQVLNLAMVGTVELPWDLFCQFAEGIRPIVLGIAYLTAAFTFFGIGRKS